MQAKQSRMLILFKTVVDALGFFPPFYLNAILGPTRTWLPPYRCHSEFHILDLKQFRRLIKYTVAVMIPPIPVNRPEWLSFLPETLFLRRTKIFVQAGHNGMCDAFPNEAWFFINGVATDKAVVQMNSGYLAALFHRPITVIHNPTNTLFLDLIECVIGKSFKRSTEPARTAVHPISEALKNPEKKRVIVIAHSQGTIIMANVLRTLIQQCHEHPQNEVDLNKLEIYAFANCADEMRYAPNLRTLQNNPVPWIENFANQYDLVARLGMLAPKKKKRKIVIDGDVHLKKEGWGHFLNEHYLHGFDNGKRDYEPVKADKKARLYGYLKGGTQPLYSRRK